MNAWNELVSHFREVALLDEIRALGAWDQQTYMPLDGATGRGEQASLLLKLAHERTVDPRVGTWIGALADADLDPVQRAGLRNMRRAYERQIRVPTELVTRAGTLHALGYATWLEARANSDWERYAPVLQQILDLQLARARAIDPDTHPYEVVLQDYDPGTTVEGLRATFARLRDGLAELRAAIARAKPMPALTHSFAPEGQRALHHRVAAAMGYDFDAGRLDQTAHPFTITLAPGDVRITTRIKPDDLFGGLYGTIHETGHALYEQGLPWHWRGTRVDQPASMGLHESQSRFWENQIGRSRQFFAWLAPILAEQFPGFEADADALYQMGNRVAAGPIRVTADEVSYNLHVIVRFEVELALFEGKLEVADIPDAWAEKYREYLGITPANHAEGALQDVHWAEGLFGYFPSYTLGNLYSASLCAQLVSDLPDAWGYVERGEFAPILGWLRQHVHAHGHLLDAPDLVRSICGERDSVKDLLDHFWHRHGALHGVSRG